MNAIDMAKMAYGSASAPVRTNRGIEYALFTQITGRLKQVQECGLTGFGAQASALHDNRKLWSVLATDVATTGNALPKSLRAQIFYLSEFVQHHSRRVLKGEGEIAVLIDINMSVMRGLASESAEQ